MNPAVFSIFIASLLLAPSASTAHGGGLDAYGCHRQTSTNSYHCHSGVYSGQSFSSKDAMLALLNSSGSGSTGGSTGGSTSGTTTPAYNRDDYLPSWADADGDCIDTRHEVLIRESAIAVTMSSSGCSVIAGLWHDPYTGNSYTNPSDVDIDHMVPLNEAHNSGAAYWTIDKKRAYANDLSNPLVLIAVDDGANQSKSDRDPAAWMPPNVAYYCDYIRNWVAIKDAYDLTIDAAERLAIDDIMLPGTHAEPEFISGARFVPGTAGETTTGMFGIGLNIADSCGYVHGARVTEEVSITGTVRPPAEHIGQVVDLFLVDRVNLAFTMRTEEGVFVPWSARVAELEPVMRSVRLTESVEVEVFEGTLGIAGDHRIFLGYKIGNDLYYTPTPVFVEVTQ